MPSTQNPFYQKRHTPSAGPEIARIAKASNNPSCLHCGKVFTGSFCEPCRLKEQQKIQANCSLEGTAKDDEPININAAIHHNFCQMKIEEYRVKP